MDHKPIPHIDSAISIPDLEFTQLGEENKQLRSSLGGQKRNEWSGKFRDERSEITRLAGSFSKQGRQIKLLEEGSGKLARLQKTQSETPKDLPKAEKCHKASEATATTLLTALSNQTEDGESDTICARLLTQWKDFSVHEATHVDVGCEIFTRTIAQEIIVAQELQAAAEVKVKEYRNEDHHTNAPEDNKEELIDASTNQSATGGLNSDISQPAQPQINYSKLELIHTHLGCTQFTRFMLQQVADAKSAREAAESEVKAYQRLQKIEKVLKDQDTVAQEAILNAARKTGVYANRVAELEKSVQVYRDFSTTTDARIAQLEQDLCTRKSTYANALSEYMEEAETFDTVSLKDLDIGDFELPSGIAANKPALDGPQAEPMRKDWVANVTININHANQRNWSLLRHIQSTISKTSKLDIQGPQDLIDTLIADMRHTEADHVGQTAAAAHWQKVAQEGLKEVDALRNELNNRPLCSVPGHRNLLDELAAKNYQLELQAVLVHQWHENWQQCVQK
ncbi:hypothetical protein GQ44DRAFT_148236 [Phaeosphaeriaceae sp. PMI808]|nr:hypothetical protein GQ44DRAFT_148236 [Phaeosphaeriaceae sp. PMI808]